MIGQTLGHYRILDKLGEGGMGVVYRAEDTTLQRQVAIKLVPPDLCCSEERLKRFKREAMALAALDHPNIVTIHSVEEADGTHFLTMQLVEGKTLDDLITREGLPLDRVLEIGIPLADALVAAHEKGIVHRDLKPGNIVITNEGRVKVLDFGIAKLNRDAEATDDSELPTETLTVAGQVQGTLPYMSPEQITGRDVDARSDIFSLGIILYEMATGERPFKGEVSATLISSILRDEPQDAERLKPGIPRHFGRIIRRCLHKDPDRRFLLVKGLRNELEELQREVSSEDEPTATIPTTAIVDRQRSWKGVIAAVSIGLVVLLAAWAIVRSMREQRTAVTPATGPPMIVVLPFENLGPPEDQYFADGMTEEITSRLAGVKGLRVISRTSATQYRDDRPSLKQIAEELDVDYVLEGTVRWARTDDGLGRVRVTPQLIRVEDDSHLWADSYDRLIEDVFEIQSSIATQVVSQLDVTLLERERQALESQPTENLEAYQAYLNGLGYVVPLTWNQDDLERAIQLFERAVELDPDFVSAHYRLSRTHLWTHFVTSPSKQHVAAGRDAAERAVALAPDNPESHLAMGYYHYLGHRDFDSAFVEFEQAYQSRPNDPEVLAAMAYIDRRRGRFDDALEKLTVATELDPRSAQRATDVGATLMFTRRWQEAKAHFERSIALDPDQVLAYVRLAEVHWLGSGDLARSRQALESSPRARSREMDEFFVYQATYERDFEQALATLATGREIWSSHHPTSLIAARLLTELGRPAEANASFEEARQWLTELLQENPPDIWWAHCHLGQALAGLGRYEEALEQAARASAAFPIDKDALEGPHLAYRSLVIFILTGEHDTAIDQLEVLLSIDGFWVPTVALLELDPTFDPLRDNPRFQALLERFG